MEMCSSHSERFAKLRLNKAPDFWNNILQTDTPIKQLSAPRWMDDNPSGPRTRLYTTAFKYQAVCPAAKVWTKLGHDDPEHSSREQKDLRCYCIKSLQVTLSDNNSRNSLQQPKAEVTLPLVSGNSYSMCVRTLQKHVGALNKLCLLRSGERGCSVKYKTFQVF